MPNLVQVLEICGKENKCYLGHKDGIITFIDCQSGQAIWAIEFGISKNL